MSISKKINRIRKLLYNFLLIALISISNVYAQDDAILKQQLQGKQNLTDIMNVVKNYYQNPETKIRLGENVVNRNMKHWTRYEWYMSSRLGPNGEFVNINEKMIEATGLQQNRKLVSENNLTNGTESTAGNWSLLGPNNSDSGIGRIDRLAFHPTSANTVYAGAAGGGLWKTTNGGTTWTNLTHDIPCLGISGIAINPVNPNIMYILTGDGDSDSPTNGGIVQNFGYMRNSIGVLKSTNAGSTWIKTGIFPGVNYSNFRSYRLIMHPTNPDILFACTNQGLFRSTDGTATWTLIENQGTYYNLKFKPGSSFTCYTILMNGTTAMFLKSTDGGISFSENPATTTKINNPSARIELAVTPANSNLVYILAGGVQNVGGFFKGLFYSNTSGDDFNLRGNSPNILGNSNTGNDNNANSWYNLSLAVSNSSASRVSVGGVEVWHSADTGVNWTYRGDDIHSDIHEMGYHPVDNKLWAATDGGVYSSTDNGVNWVAHLDGMSISQFYRIAVSPADIFDMLGGTQDNGILKRVYGTSTFTELRSGDGFNAGYDPLDATVYYVVTNQAVRRYTNSGNNPNNITPPVTPPFGMSMAIHTTNDSSLFVGGGSTWRTTDAGSNWTRSVGVQSGWFIRTCPSNGNRIYIAGGIGFQPGLGSLRRSDDGGATWPNILSNNTDFPESFGKITSINVHPNNSNWVWVTFGGFAENTKVYFSSNAGGTWFNRSGTLPNIPVHTIAIDNNNNAYIGTDNGVYYRGSNMTDWVPFYNNLPYVPVTDIVISETDNRIRAATFGRGIWASDMYNDCPTNLNITGTLEGQKFYEVSNNVASTATLTGSEGTKVQMRGANEVKLTDGFSANENSQFKAMVGPCGSGGVAGFKVAIIDSSMLLPPQQYLPPQGGKKALIHIQSVSNNEIQLVVTQRLTGPVEFILTNEEGKIIRHKNIPTSKIGVWNDSISATGLKPGIYYLQLIVDKRVEHLQELMIK